MSGRFRDRSHQRAAKRWADRCFDRANDRLLSADDGPFPERLSNRFLRPQELQRYARPSLAWGPYELFPDGQWQDIRVSLERQGWNCSQIAMVHDQLRQGWPLAMARHNVAALTGHCPLRSRQQG